MGFLAWDKRTGEIVYSLPKPSGGYEDSYNWDYIFKNNPDYPEFIETSNNGPELTLFQIKDLYRVVNGQLNLKPKPFIEAEPVIANKSSVFTLKFNNLLDGETFTDLKAVIDGDNLHPVEIELQSGDNILEFAILGKLSICITDKRVQKYTFDFEVMIA